MIARSADPGLRRGSKVVAITSTAGALVVFSFAPPAHAVEKEHRIGVDVGGSLLDVADKDSVSLGAGLGAHYVYGLSDQFNLLAEGSASFVSLKEPADEKTPHTRPTTLSHLAVGIAYTLDVMTLVPYFGILAGGFAMGGGTLDHTLFLPGGQLALGADYKLSHRWSVGLAYRQTMFLTNTSTYPSYSNLFARVEYSWGW